VLACAAIFPFVGAAIADDGRGACVHNLKILSDKIDDVTTIDNIVRSFIKPGMTDQERAKALWTAAVRYRHQAPPPP
jgi:hypothetical protein